MNYKTLTLTLLLGLASLQAQAKMTMNHEGHDMSQMEGMDMQAMEERVMTKGVITRLDEASGKVGLKVGDVVSFLVENPAGKLTVTQLQKR